MRIHNGAPYSLCKREFNVFTALGPLGRPPPFLNRRFGDLVRVGAAGTSAWIHTRPMILCCHGKTIQHNRQLFERAMSAIVSFGWQLVGKQACCEPLTPLTPRTYERRHRKRVPRGDVQKKGERLHSTYQICVFSIHRNWAELNGKV